MRLKSSVALLLTLSIFTLSGCSPTNEGAERCENFQVVLNNVFLLGGLSMKPITDELLPELISKSEEPLRSNFQQILLSYELGIEPDFGEVLEVCSALGVELSLLPDGVNWDNIDLGELDLPPTP